MGSDNKVVWSEGLFIRPQHFQQQDRHMERWVEGRCRGLRRFDWGFAALEWELGVGTLALRRCQGRFKDGTPFELPGDAPLPAPLEIASDCKNTLVYLALPQRRRGAAEVASVGSPDPLARYRQHELAEVADYNSGAGAVQPLQVGLLQARLALGRVEDHTGLPVARVLEVRGAGEVLLEQDFIPPVLECAASPELGGYLRDLVGLLNLRGEALASNSVEAARLGGAGVANFLLLQTINRHEPLFRHVLNAGLHPEDFYRLGLQLAGDLSVFFGENQRPAAFPAYDHDNLKACFGPLLKELRRLLAQSIGSNTIRITLVERTDGFYGAPKKAEYQHLLGNAAFVLGVKANVGTETLRSEFPGKVKIAAVEDIYRLRDYSLSGIEVSPLLQLPPTLPVRPEFCYFGLGTQGEHWEKMPGSKGFALHIGGHFPGLQLEFWAVGG